MNKLLKHVTCLLVVGLFFFGRPGFAQEKKATLESLSTEIRALQTELKSLDADGHVLELKKQVLALQSRVDVLSRSSASSDDFKTQVTTLEGNLIKLETQVNALRGEVANRGMPAVAPSSGGSLGSGLVNLKIGGLAQSNLAWQIAETFDRTEELSFSVPRARIDTRFTLSNDNRFSARVHAGFGEGNARLLDGNILFNWKSWLQFKAGQMKLPYSRSFLTDGMHLAFFERALATEALRYDRELGVMAMGTFLDRKGLWQFGVFNSSGPGNENRNIDTATALRVDFGVLGSRIGYQSVDFEKSNDLRITFGAGIVHDLFALPVELAGVAFGDRDVDNDGFDDNVRVWSGSLDVVMRVMGFELQAELLARHERWGAILNQLDNGGVTVLVQPDSQGRRNYLSQKIQLTYLFKDSLVFGGRFSHTRVPLVRLTGQALDSTPEGDRQMRWDLLSRWYSSSNLDDSFVSAGAMLSFINHNNLIAITEDNDKSYRLLLEAQFRF